MPDHTETMLTVMLTGIIILVTILRKTVNGEHQTAVYETCVHIVKCQPQPGTG